MNRIVIALMLLLFNYNVEAQTLVGVNVLGLKLTLGTSRLSHIETYSYLRNENLRLRRNSRRIREINRINRAEEFQRRYERLLESTKPTSYGMPDYMYHRRLEWEKLDR